MSIDPEEFTDEPTGRGGAIPMGTAEEDQQPEDPELAGEQDPDQVVSGGGVISQDPTTPDDSAEATGAETD